MKKKIFYLNFLFILFFANMILPQSKEIVAYYHGNYSDENIGHEKLIESIGLFDKITIINYAFAIPKQDENGKTVPHITNQFHAYEKIYPSDKSVDGIADDSSQILKGQFNQLKKIKSLHPHLKILISIGGWGGSTYFSDLALTHESREHFVNSCIDMFILGNLPISNNSGGKNSALGVFDGIDLDWEFPITGGPEGTHYNPNDRENHTALFKLFREKLNEINPNLLLTAAVTGRSNEFWLYNFNEDQNYLDWFNLMSYDLHGVADEFSNHHTNLLSSENDIDPKKESLDRMVRYLIDSVNVKPEKIIPGAAYYGKGWGEVDSLNNGLYQKGKFLNRWGYIRFKNYLDFKELNEKGFNYFWDDNTLAPFLYNPKEKIFWSFDDLRSIALKSRYVDAFNLRGLMFWQTFGDDSLGNLTNTIYYRNMPEVKFDKTEKENLKPTIKIISPNTQNNFKTGENIIIKTISNDEDGKVVKVEFFVDDNSVGYNIFEPYNWAWFNASQGEHTIYCIAYDNFGKSTISEKVKIFIQKK
ncbi:MAG: glycosyl hydrolase family 18 protein [Melioribacteraceae bacterium]